MANDIDPDELERFITQTKIRCGSCGDPIHFGDEVFSIRIVQPQVVDQAAKFNDIFTEKGELRYRPYFFEFMCWELIEEQLREHYDDMPPVTDARAIIGCDICGSDIREGEVMGLVRFGELHCSPRSPQGVATTIFHNIGKDKHLCIGCLYVINDDSEEYWEGDIECIPGIHVCREGIFERCWRRGACNCPHQTVETEEEKVWPIRR